MAEKDKNRAKNEVKKSHITNIVVTWLQSKFNIFIRSPYSFTLHPCRAFIPSGDTTKICKKNSGKI